MGETHQHGAVLKLKEHPMPSMDERRVKVMAYSAFTAYKQVYTMRDDGPIRIEILRQDRLRSIVAKNMNVFTTSDEAKSM